MENTKGIKAVGLVVYFILLNFLFLLIGSGIAGSNLGDMVIEYEKNSLTFDGADFSGAATLFSGMAFLTTVFITVLSSIIFSIIAIAISNAIFNGVCFKNNKHTKDILLKDLNVVNLPVLIISIIFILAPNLQNNIGLIMIGTTYYIVFWLISYLLLRAKINKVNLNN